MFKKVLIANRGEIACRIIRTLKRLGVKSVAVYSEADHASQHVDLADEAVLIGPAAVDQSYLKAERIIQAALDTGAEAIHPGYGLLSENAGFADACAAAGIVFIGPTGDNMRAFGLKHTARELAKSNNVSLLPGTDLLSDVDTAAAAAERIGYPVILKSTAGGGGIGMRVCSDAAQLGQAFESVRRLSESHFGQAGMYLEKFIAQARHVEVQIFGDGRGDVIALGERDCSAQRRNQKVIEETPAPHLSESTRRELQETAVRLAKAVAYRSAGTVEFVLDAITQQFYFLEVNTRLQVEHPVTEAVHNVDLVGWMVRLAAGDLPPLHSLQSTSRGHSIEVRLYAEDPAKNFQPSAGLLTEVTFPTDARVDTWVQTGSEVSPHYDPLVAKLIVHADTRDTAIEKMSAALSRTRLEGIETNLFYLRDFIASDVFRAGKVITKTLAGFNYYDPSIDVLAAGNFSTVQDYPGRLGYWDVGIPPNGPMDHLSFRLGNRIVGNTEGVAGLELTITGPTLKFNRKSTICLAGAPMTATMDGQSVPYWCAFDVPAGATLKLGAIQGAGCRTYLLVRGGIDVPDYLGSRSTFTLGLFGGHGGRTLRTGDVLHLAEPDEATLDAPLYEGLAADLIPPLTNDWQIGVLDGPHAAPDFFLPADIEMLYATAWQVHYNSARTGVRLIGPKPQWARPDGGDAGLHPSNIHDTAYSIGAVDFTGDMPIILGPDGPSCGGFVCPVTIVQAELWKMGQLRPGDRVKFVSLRDTQANEMERAQDAAISQRGTGFQPVSSAQAHGLETHATQPPQSPLLHTAHPVADRPMVTYRRNGDQNVLVEYGPMVLDFDLRFRVHALMQWFADHPQAGVIDLVPGIRSLQVHFDSRVLPQRTLLDTLMAAEEQLPSIEDMAVPSRIVHLPLSWDDPATRLAIEKYMQSVRPDAPWCPSNLEFIRRVNGLSSIDDVYKIVFDASYLVLALGDVYLGAPVATPVDPRHRLVTTKYNPARTWTAENSVGIGGAYLCIYGMEGPGGYQFVGRTVQQFNRWRQTADFTGGKPWLLRFFDQVKFYPVTADELLRIRDDFVLGRFKLKVEETTFRLRDYHAFTKANADSIAGFRATQQAAFGAERQRWEAAGEFKAAASAEASTTAAPVAEAIDIPAGAEAAESPMVANVWKVVASEGQQVKAGDTLVILEAMKMETTVVSPCDGVVLRVTCKPGQMVMPGTTLCVVKGK
ncbi:MAG TPA: urea carboxylase [Tepidisphaeraceae bacterium]|jgi:urea carboxylase|nr:urea carboxylase [Tepidisphaeraceae bacterium]